MLRSILRFYRGNILGNCRQRRHRKLSSGRFTIRRLTTADEVATLTTRAAQMGRKPGALDHISYFAADNTGFYVGEVNGQVVCCLSAVKYSGQYAFLGHYMVDEPFRGRGYGIKLSNTVVDSLPRGCNFAVDTIEESVPWLKDTFGLSRAWRNQHATVTAAQGSLALSGVRNPFIVVQPIPQVPFKRLFDYDTSVHGYPRAPFLDKWIYAPNCYSFAVTNSDGTVVGYTVVRTLIYPEDGWKIGPLFADNAAIARSLYKAVFEKVAAEDGPSTTVTISVPFGDLTNPDALNITKELSAKPERTTARMYKYGVPPAMQLQKTFVLTSSVV